MRKMNLVCAKQQSTMTLTPSKTTEHFFNPILSPRYPAQQAKIDGLDPVALGVTEEDILWLERAELGAGLVVANAKEVVVRHAPKAGDEVAVVIVVGPSRMLLKGGHPRGVDRGGSIVRSGSGPI